MIQISRKDSYTGVNRFQLGNEERKGILKLIKASKLEKGVWTKLRKDFRTEKTNTCILTPFRAYFIASSLRIARAPMRGICIRAQDSNALTAHGTLNNLLVR